ncbi:MAG TPA: 3'-5' exonuclease [Capsulimonadaceae bacterium]|jgi:DNA polymerase elongation subunit (family B)
MPEIDLDTVLYGADPTLRVVAVEPDLNTNTVALFVRRGDGAVERQTRRFVPWLLTQSERHFEGSTTRRLDGDGHCWRIDFDGGGWQGFLNARRALRDDNAGAFVIMNATKQFCTGEGVTLFKGMVFDDLRRMQIDIETTGLSCYAPDACIIMVAVSDSTGKIDVLADTDERALLQRLIATVREWDPDVIEGHNFFGFDLPYIAARCASHNIPCTLGRDGGPPVAPGLERNVSIGANSRPFTPYYVYGRHIVDTYFAVQRFDIAKGQISSYGLKECARVYGIAPPDRVYLDGRDIAEIYARDPETVIKYAAQDVEETRALAALVTPTEFYQTQMAPDSYQSVAVTGTGEKVNSLLVREYLRQGRAIPMQQPSVGFGGGYTEVRETGVISPVVKADVESLYPSVMLTQRIKPATDTLDIFLPLLSELTKRRLTAKAEVSKHATGTTERAYWDGLQNSFKVLINSFYGYIGGPFHFNDYRAADQVTESGRALVKQIAAELEATGSTVIEIDTDGVYFRPPDDVSGVESETAYIDRVGSVLPAGIRLAHDGRYRAMLSLKIKNYVLEDENGRKIFKGSSLRSRADEKFGRRFLESAVDLLLSGRIEDLTTLYAKTQAAIDAGEFGIDDLTRRERVTAKMLSSDLKKRAADALKSSTYKEGDIVQLYQRADRSLALASEYAGDEDREYYAEKLYKFAGRLRDAFKGDDFDRLFPKPLPYSKRPDPNQGAFGF